MTFKPSVWHPIAVVLSILNFAGVGYAVAVAEPWHAVGHVALGLGFGLWARRLKQGPAEGELGRMKQDVEQQAAALEDVETTLASLSSQIEELQERVDFTERVLAQARDRPALGGKEDRG